MPDVCRNRAGPASISTVQRPALVVHRPLNTAEPVRDLTVAVLVNVLRNNLAAWTEPDLKLPASKSEQLQSSATLEFDDHNAESQRPAAAAPDPIALPAAAAPSPIAFPAARAPLPICVPAYSTPLPIPSTASRFN